MGLDIGLSYQIDGNSVGVFDRNITHNLWGMAAEAGIYEALWRPDENGYEKASDITGPTIVSGTTPDGRFTWVGPGYSARKESQKTILEKAIERLEGKKRTNRAYDGMGCCSVCDESDTECRCGIYDYAMDQSIAELRSLLAEVDT